MLLHCNHVTSATLESWTTSSAKITEMAFCDVSGHHVRHLQPMQYTLFLVWCIQKVSELQRQPSLTSLHAVQRWTLDDSAMYHNLATFPKLRALSFHHELGAAPANGVAPAEVTMEGILAMAQGLELSYIGLGGLHGLTRPIVKQLQRLFKLLQHAGVAKDPVYLLLQLEPTHGARRQCENHR